MGATANKFFRWIRTISILGTFLYGKMLFICLFFGSLSTNFFSLTGVRLQLWKKYPNEIYMHICFLYACDYREKAILQAWKRFIGQFALSSPTSSSSSSYTLALRHLLFHFFRTPANGMITLSDGVQDHFSVLFDQFRDEILREYIHPLKLWHMYERFCMRLWPANL